MTSRPRGRYCQDCRKTVHDLSAMTEPEAEAFLRQTEHEDVCISYEYDPRGRVVFREPALVPLARLRRARGATATAVGVGMAAALAACTPHRPPATTDQDAGSPAFSSPAVVIPHAAPAATTTAEPVEWVEEPTFEPVDHTPPVIKRPRIRGRRPVRKMGKLAPPMPVIAPPAD